MLLQPLQMLEVFAFLKECAYLTIAFAPLTSYKSINKKLIELSSHSSTLNLCIRSEVIKF